VMKCMLAGALVGMAVALLLPWKYEATSRILPPQPIASVMPNQLGPLSALAGKDLGIRNPTDLFVAILQSRTVADDLINYFSLKQVYKKTTEKTRKRLAEVTSLKAGKDGIITISVQDHDAGRAAALANSYVEELRKLVQSLAVSEARHRRIFFEQEVQKVRDDLAKAETALKQTQEKTGMIQPDSQAMAVIQGYMALRTKVAAKETQIEAMKAFATSENPDLIRARQELSALRSQALKFERGRSVGANGGITLENVPRTSLEYLRRLREVRFREALLELLAKQYEIARIDEGKDAAVIQVVDPAIRPEIQVFEWRQRAAFAFAIFIIAFVGGAGAAFIMEGLETAKEDTRFASQARLVKHYLFANPLAKNA